MEKLRCELYQIYYKDYIQKLSEIKEAVMSVQCEDGVNGDTVIAATACAVGADAGAVRADDAVGADGGGNKAGKFVAADEQCTAGTSDVLEKLQVAGVICVAGNEIVAGEDDAAVAGGEDGTAIAHVAGGEDVAGGESVAGEDGIAVAGGESVAGEDGVAVAGGESVAGEDGIAVAGGGSVAGGKDDAAVAVGAHVAVHGVEVSANVSVGKKGATVRVQRASEAGVVDKTVTVGPLGTAAIITAVVTVLCFCW
nr:PREDICTED: uncharacterized PE-PGRS family protein PE_PGRS54-like isoform X1 [Latimeria chalumnae]|eukprot:XP_014349271.1 PREDICTED: uncharacterized PE-PGRS family protein PE_PGRS54-like isoform X1 [Latimeria chalumnae]